MRRRVLAGGVIVLLLVVAGLVWGLVRTFSSSSSLHGLGISPPREAPDFVLKDQYGRPFHLAAQRGKVVLIYFGYTHCTDVCPAVLALWRIVHDKLGKDAARVRWVYITVDPDRDTPARLREHLAYFSRDFIGLTGTLDELTPVYQAYGVLRSSSSHSGHTHNDEEEGLTHSAFFYVIDPRGVWVENFAFGASPDDIVQDIRQLLKRR